MDKKLMEFQKTLEQRKTLNQKMFELIELQTELIEKIKIAQFELIITQDEYFESQTAIDKFKNELELLDDDLLNYKF